VRGRIGYAWDRFMLYATGGLAYGEVGLGGTHIVFLSGPPLISTGIGHSQINIGWTGGAGFEAVLAGNWTWKAEYLYADLGFLDDAGTCPTCGSGIFPNGGRTATHTHFTDNIVRAGLNYKFY
jgi:outer membrane immunogenic protein